MPVPTFGRWTDQSLETGKRVDMFPLAGEHGFALDVDAYLRFIRARGSRVAVLCNPNNPDGGYLPRREVLRFMDELTDLDLVVVDESFIDFMDAEPDGSVARDATIRPNVVVLKSLGKNFGLHGIRFGYLVANPALARRMAAVLPKWNLNSLAETVVFMLRDHEDAYRASLEQLSEDRYRMALELAALDMLEVYPSQANFLLVKLADGLDGPELRDYLLAEHRRLRPGVRQQAGHDQPVPAVGGPAAGDVARLVGGLRQFTRRREGGRVLTVASLIRRDAS